MRRWVGWAIVALMHSFLAGQAVAQSRASPFYGNAAGAEQQALLEVLRTSQMAERMAGVVNVTLALRADLRVGFRSCRSPNAFFNPQMREITICLEFLQLAAKTAAEDQDFLLKQPREEFS